MERKWTVAFSRVDESIITIEDWLRRAVRYDERYYEEEELANITRLWSEYYAPGALEYFQHMEVVYEDTLVVLAFPKEPPYKARLNRLIRRYGRSVDCD